MRRYRAHKVLMQKRRITQSEKPPPIKKEVDIPPLASAPPPVLPNGRLASIVEQKFQELGQFVYTEPD